MNLQIIEKATAKFKWNFEEYKGQLEKNLEKYSGLVITESNYKESKEVLISLGKQEKIIKELAKDFKDPFKKAVEEVTSQEKELLSIVNQYKNPIKQEIDFFVKKKEDEKREKIEAIRLEIAEEFELMCKYKELLTIRDTYVRESTSIKKATEGLREDAEKLKEQQEMEQLAIIEIQKKKETIEIIAKAQSQAFGLTQDITYDEVKHLADKDMGTITVEIINIAQRIKEREAKAIETVIPEVVEKPVENAIKPTGKNTVEAKAKGEEVVRQEVTLKFTMTPQEAEGLLTYLKTNKISYEKVI